MKKPSLTVLIVATVLTALATGCAGRARLAGRFGAGGVEIVRVAGTGQEVSASRSGRFDMEVSGSGNTVRVPAPSEIRILRVSGVNHRITVAAGATVRSVWMSGNGTAIHLPKDVHPVVRGSGEGGQIVNDVDGGG